MFTFCLFSVALSQYFCALEQDNNVSKLSYIKMICCVIFEYIMAHVIYNSEIYHVTHYVRALKIYYLIYNHNY